MITILLWKKKIHRRSHKEHETNSIAAFTWYRYKYFVQEWGIRSSWVSDGVRSWMKVHLGVYVVPLVVSFSLWEQNGFKVPAGALTFITLVTVVLSEIAGHWHQRSWICLMPAGLQKPSPSLISSSLWIRSRPNTNKTLSFKSFKPPSSLRSLCQRNNRNIRNLYKLLNASSRIF